MGWKRLLTYISGSVGESVQKGAAVLVAFENGCLDTTGHTERGGHLHFLSMVPAEKIVGPSARPAARPVARPNQLPHQRFLLTIGLEPLIGPHKDAPTHAGKDLAPPFGGSPALAVEKEFGTLRLRTEEAYLGQRAVSTPATAGADKLYPILKFG